MSGAPGLRQALLVALLDGAIRADTMEDGLAFLAERLGTDLPPATIAAAVQEIVAASLVHEPVRLPPGALQCHWRLELTAQGRQAALGARRSGVASPSASAGAGA